MLTLCWVPQGPILEHYPEIVMFALLKDDLSGRRLTTGQLAKEAMNTWMLKQKYFFLIVSEILWND